jgi:hypothetical protein
MLMGCLLSGCFLTTTFKYNVFEGALVNCIFGSFY